MVTNTLKKSSYDCDGFVDTFAVTFAVTTDIDGNAENLKVTLTDSEGNETDITDSSTIEGLNVTVATVYAAGYKVTLSRNIPITQVVDFIRNDTEDPQTIEDLFDQITLINQDQQDQIDRSFKIPISDDAEDMTVPTKAMRKGHFLGFTADTGEPIAADPTNVPVSVFMQTLLDDADATAALATLGLTVSAFAKTLLDDADATEAMATLGIKKYAELAASTTAAVNTNYLLDDGVDLTLPASAVAGDSLTVWAKGASSIKQSDAEHGISQGNDFLTSTKGAAGKVVLSADRVDLTYVGAGRTIVPASKLADPATLPATKASGAAWSPDSRYLAYSAGATPYMCIYDFNSGSPVKMADPATLPPGVTNGVAWSPSGRYVAFASSTSPYVVIYDMNSGAPVKLADPASLPTGAALGVGWSPDSRYLAFAHGTSRYITIYDMNTGTPVKISDPSTLPTSTGNCAAWSPDGTKMAVGTNLTPFVVVYDWNSGVPVKMTDPGVLPAGQPFGAAWSPDSRYLALAHNASPYASFYDYITGGPVKLDNPGLLPAGVCRGVGYGPRGRFVAFAHDSAPYLSVYDMASGAPAKIAAPASTPTGANGYAAAYSPDGKYLAWGGGTVGPTAVIYQVSDSVSKVWRLSGLDVATRFQ